MGLSRRGLISTFFKPLKAGGEKARQVIVRHQEAEVPRVAAIQGRYCLAFQDEFCSVCYERCPVPGAIELDDALPRIVRERCTGCGVCHEVCPAPQNAVLITPRGAPSPT